MIFQVLYVVIATCALLFYVIRYYILTPKYHIVNDTTATASKQTITKESSEQLSAERSKLLSSADGTKKIRYLPEEIFCSFLSNIKIFQYIDKNVLLEFAKNSSQMKLYPGEILSLVGKRDLVLVMDGCLQLYWSSSPNLPQSFPQSIKSPPSYIQQHQNNVEHEQQQQQQQQHRQHLNSDYSDYVQTTDGESSPLLSSNSAESISNDAENIHLLNEVSAGGMASSLFDVLSIYTSDLSNLHPLDSPQTNTNTTTTSTTTTTSPDINSHNSTHYLFTRSVAETTLLVIPEATFRRVANFHRAATIQLIQVILTRFQRVTYTTMYKYLGLTHELLRIERELNEHDGEDGEVLNLQELERLREILKSEEDVSSATETISFKSPSMESLRDGLPRPRSSLSHSHQDLTVKTMDTIAEVQAPEQTTILSATSPQISQTFPSSSTATVLPERPFLSERQIKEFVFQRIATIIGYNSNKSMIFNSAVPKNPLVSILATSKSERSSPRSSPAASRTQSITPIIIDVVSELEIKHYMPGDSIVEFGSRGYGLMYVIHGLVNVYAESQQKDYQSFTVRAGQTIGYFSSIIGHPSLIAAKARSEVFIGVLPKHCMDYLSEKSPTITCCLSKKLLRTITPLVRHIDLALEWQQVNAGQALYEQGQSNSEYIYLVLNGRLRSVHGSGGGEYGQGESVGELEVLTRTSRTTTIQAVRDTELSCIPQTLFHTLALKYPEITIHVSRLLASRGQKQLGPPPNLNLRTIALLPAHPEVPIIDFAERLKDAVLSTGEMAIVLDGSTVTSALGRHAFSKMGKLKLLSWLGEQEENSRLVLYTADTGPQSPWTLRCIRQADCVLIIGIAGMSPEVGEYEKTLMKLMKTFARKELVLLHADRSVTEGSTLPWLLNRPWLYRHHHVQVPLLMVSRGLAAVDDKSLHRPIIRQTPFEDLKSQFERLAQQFRYKNLLNQQPSTSVPKQQSSRNDFLRLARRLTGKSIGLALGGGGARGIAHIGIIRAFSEAGIPIDLIGGVSIGALIGGLFALNEDIWYVYWRAKDFANRNTSVWRQLLDLTYPLASYFTGHEFNRAVWKCFGKSQLEDSWVNFVCLTTNITHSRMEVHSLGTIWRYVRASMSLCGYLPPLCDNGDMLVDGGYLNNLPGDVIRSRGGDTVIAIDVSSEEQVRKAEYGDALSGLYALFTQFNPFSKAYIPTLADIQSRLAYVSCVKQLEDLKNMDGCIYLRPPVGNFGTMDFAKFDEIFEVGYQFGLKVVKGWEEDGTLLKWQNVTKKKKSRARRNSI